MSPSCRLGKRTSESLLHFISFNRKKSLETPFLISFNVFRCTTFLFFFVFLKNVSFCWKGVFGRGQTFPRLAFASVPRHGYASLGFCSLEIHFSKGLRKKYFKMMSPSCRLGKRTSESLLHFISFNRKKSIETPFLISFNRRRSTKKLYFLCF